MHKVCHDQRRQARLQVEMFAGLRCGIATNTVMLKDLTRHGARIEGVAGLVAEQPVSLVLPGRRPLIAFVAWANDHCAGLEFAEPLEWEVFIPLTVDHGLSTGNMPLAA